MPVKKIIIIGSSSGLWKELAILYAQQNHMVCVTGRRHELLEELKTKHPSNMIVSAFDVTAGDNKKQIESLIEKLGGLDLLIYNAGYGEPSLKLIPETERMTTLTNVNGFVEIVSYVFNYFAQKGRGHIALISSISALRGNSWTPAYSASKAFMSNYAEGLSIKARKLKKDIIITDVKPGFIKTKMAKGNKQFWVAPVDKAALQITKAIEKKKEDCLYHQAVVAGRAANEMAAIRPL